MVKSQDLHPIRPVPDNSLTPELAELHSDTPPEDRGEMGEILGIRMYMEGSQKSHGTPHHPSHG